MSAPGGRLGFMSDLDPATVILRYWAACEARDWVSFGELVAEDVWYELPQSRERIRGRADYVASNATYPGAWHVRVERVVADGVHAASWTTFVVDGTEQSGLCFFDLDECGLIRHITDFWPAPFDPPPWRHHLTDRF
jgi:hypothetical protein